MNSLFELNQYSTRTVVAVTDDRLATVIFDRPDTVDATDQILDIASQTINLSPGLEIEEIVNYATADVRYEIYIKEAVEWVSGSSTIAWTSLPNNVTLTTNGTDTYTLSGLRDKTDWDAVKNFTWNLPASYENGKLWYLIVKVIWYDEANDEDTYRAWLVFDPDFYTVAQFKSSSSLTVTGRKLFRPSLQFTTTAGFFCAEGLAKQARAQLNAVFDLNVDASVTQLATLNSSASMTTVGSKIVSSAVAGLNASASVSVSGTVFQVITNITDRVYVANNKNNVFSSNVPQITDPVDTTYTVSITSPFGEFGTSSDLTTSSSTLTYTGSKSSVNTWLSSVVFYPNKDYTGNTTYSVTVTRTGLSVTRTANLSYASTGTITPELFVFNTSGSDSLGDFATYTWSPIVEYRKYAVMDYLIVGAGEDGVGYGVGNFATGRGGRGGQVISGTGVTISNSSYTVNVGASGEGTGSKSSSFNGQTATLTSYSNGATATVSSTEAYGGGAGAGANGSDGSITGTGPYTVNGGNGGAGVSSNITGTTYFYGPGGGGGFSASSGDTATRGTNATGYPTLRYGGGGQGQSFKSPSTYGGGEPGRSGVVIIKVR
jgi:hypothetical protein